LGLGHASVMAKSIGVSELRRLMDAGTQVVDVLPVGEYRDAHLPGAVNIPLKQLGARTAQALDRTRPVAVYCWDSL
jgi:rhodanese-related sulfurtransferase